MIGSLGWGRVLLTLPIGFLAIAFLGQPLLAATLPNSGSLIQTVPAQPNLPKQDPAFPALPDQQESGSARSAGPSITVRQIKLIGITAFSAEEVALAIGLKTAEQQLTLAELKQTAQKVTIFYREHGYFLAQAYLPQQDIQNGAVTIAVLEGRFGAIKSQNESDLNGFAVGVNTKEINSGDLVTLVALERQVLLLNDLPGVDAKSLLSPGSEVGTTDLTLAITSTQQFTAVLSADNNGNPYTGAERASATLNANELLGLGDLASLYGMRSSGAMQFVRASYQVQLAGLKVGVAKTDMSYTLGGSFASLGASGTMQIGTVNASYPLIRSRAQNLNAQFSFDAKKANDLVNSQSYQAIKQVKVYTLTAQGDFKDKWLEEGTTNYILSYLTGNVDLQSAAAQINDSQTAQTAGRYGKVALSLSRNEQFGPLTSVRMNLNAQWASKNMDATEKMVLGGPTGVRAYPSGEATGDEGYLATLESQTLVPEWAEYLPGQIQLGGFVDEGQVKLARAPWTAGPNTRGLGAVGMAAHWFKPDDLVDVKVSIAHKLGDAVALSDPDARWRAWATLTKYF